MDAPADYRYWCAECTKRYPEAGSCPVHTEEPLLDLRDEEVWLMLDEQDDRRKWQRIGVIAGAAAACTLVVTVAIMLGVDEWTARHPEIDLDGPNPIRLFVVFGVGFFFAGYYLFPAPKTAPQVPDAERKAMIGSSDAPV